MLYRKFVYIYIYMFSFPREMEVSVSMKNGHKRNDFFNVEEKYPIFKMKNKRYERIFK